MPSCWSFQRVAAIFTFGRKVIYCLTWAISGFEFFSSPEQKLKVSFVITLCPSSVRLDETWSECLPLWNLGQVRYWVTWGQKLGHQVKSKEKLVNTLQVIVLTQSWWNLLKMFASFKSRSSSKLGHLGSKSRSPGQISRKPCKLSSGHIFEAIIMNLAQYICLDDF